MTKKTPDPLEDFDWSRTTFEGTRREQLRIWAALPLDQVIRALQEMEELSASLAKAKPLEDVSALMVLPRTALSASLAKAKPLED